MILFAVAFAFLQDPAATSVRELLSRAAEEAEIFQQNAPRSITQETLEQRAVMAASRFRPRIGNKLPPDPPKPRLVLRQIVSEYSVVPLKDSTDGNLVELRQVVAVDGRKVQSVETARHALSLGIKSPDERVRKRMLEDFARHGLVDVATDYGTILLAFGKRGQQNMRIVLAGEEQVGADSAWVLAWQQITPAGGILEFAGNQADRRALQGKLLVRKTDGLPLRIQAWSEHAINRQLIRDEATVDYIQSAHGFLTPASVLHRHYVDANLMTENHYRYEPFKMFGADTEIKFTELTDMPPSPTVKK
uniref:Uncharacterized protein n=1 Tax=Solibacter usitatus (strain Ellin6076) TaxID=234267 RepID=Q02AB8_SOLUE